MKKILVPVDFSEYCTASIMSAIMLARKADAEIRLLHVFDDPFVDHDMREINLDNEVTKHTEELIHKMETDARSKMQTTESDVYRFMQEQGISIPVTTEIRRGFAVDEIVDASRTWMAQLIIMGARGHSRLEKMVFGTVTKGVINQAKCAVLALPVNYQWRDPYEVVYATDFNDYDPVAISKVLNLLHAFHINLHITHFNTDKNEEADHEQMGKLAMTLQEDHKDGNISYEIVDSKVLLSAMEQYTESKNIDLIALTTRKMSTLQKVFTKSATINLLYHANRPLLVFHER